MEARQDPVMRASVDPTCITDDTPINPALSTMIDQMIMKNDPKELSYFYWSMAKSYSSSSLLHVEDRNIDAIIRIPSPLQSVSTCDEFISLIYRRRKCQTTMLISLLIISVNISQKVMNF
jgi:hypothetical protein